MLHMPRFQPRPEEEMRALFAKARAFTEEKRLLYATQRHVVFVTPGRQLIRLPCPKPGSMGQKDVRGIQELLPNKAKQRITVIAFNDIASVTNGGQKPLALAALAQHIPFLGILRGMSILVIQW
jgi:hypothetical protein